MYRKSAAGSNKRLMMFIGVALAIIVGLLAIIIITAQNNAEKTKIYAIATLSPSMTPEPVPTPGPDTADPSGSPDISPSPAPGDEDTISISIKAVGDIAIQTDVLAGAYDSSTGGYDFTRLFSKIADSLKSDFTIASFETVTLDTATAAYSGRNQYNSPFSVIDAMKEAGIDAVTLANSHILDHGMDGIRQTTAKLDEAGIAHFGAYNSQEEAEANRLQLVDVKGIKIAVLAYTEDVRGNLQSLTTAQQSFAVNISKREDILADIGRAREKGAEVVIVALHWGELFTNEPSSTMRSLAEAMLTAGADVILGTHTQMVQRITNKTVDRNDGSQARGIVAYSLGNFVSEYRDVRQDSGIVLNINIEKDVASGEVTVNSPTFTPIWIDKISESGTYIFEVVKMQDYYDSAGTMSSASHTRLKAAWSEIMGTIDSDAAALAE
ncbi:MAG: CapA family protein [Christensenellales bacterium]|jgi:poly-gamma-glutamate capsule biosynthesis protein CapA/YwtB (metallophosphatase superfamily)